MRKATTPPLLLALISVVHTEQNHLGPGLWACWSGLFRVKKGVERDRIFRLFLLLLKGLVEDFDRLVKVGWLWDVDPSSVRALLRVLHHAETSEV